MAVKVRSVITFVVIGGAALYFFSSTDPVIRGIRAGLFGMFSDVSSRYDAQVEICVEIAKKFSIAPTSVTVTDIDSREFADSTHVRVRYDAKDNWYNWGPHEIDCVFDESSRQEEPVSVRIDKKLVQ